MEKIIERPVLASIFFAIIILLGVYSYNEMPIELVPDPEEKLPSLNVRYFWWGASPDMILRKVLIPAEEEIAQIKGVAKINSRATQNNGRIRVEFSRDTRMNFASVVLRERLNRLQKELPAQVGKPNIQNYVPEEFKKEPFFNVGVYGPYSIYTLKRIVEREILPYLKAIPGIESINMWGGVEPEIKIQTNIDKLKKFDIGIEQIRYRLNQYFFNLQSSSIKKEANEIILSLTESAERIQEIQDIVVGSLGEKKILLKDVANVFFGYEDMQYEQRYQGNPVIGLQMYKQANTSSLQMAGKVREKLQYLANKLNGRVEFVIQSDESKELRERLSKLLKIAFLILIVIFIILISIIRDVKSSFLIFSSVFFSVFATFTAIYVLKTLNILTLSLNLLTLSGLALGFGLFVDNAVVVFDSILRHREKGFGRKEAAIRGAKAVFLPVLSATITTIIVFFSFAYFEGRLKIYYLPLAYIIAISLLSSIVVSFILIPSLSARINLKTKQKKVLFKTGRFFPLILKYPVVIIIPLVLLFIHSYTVFKEEVSFGQFFSWYSKEKIVVWLRFPSGAEFEDVKEAIVKFENLSLQKSYKKEITTTIYPQGAYMIVTFPEEVEFSAAPYQLKQELVGLATNLAGIGVSVSGFDPENYYYNPDTGSFLPYSIQIRGYNFERLMQFAGELKKSLLNHRRIKDVEILTDMEFWWGGKDKYFAFQLDREKLKIYRLEPRFLYALISTLVRERSRGQKLKFDDKELSVEVKSEDVDDLELDDILNMYLGTMEGIAFRLKDVVDIELTTQKGGITRENQEYVAMVRWDYLGSAKSADRFHKTIYNNLKVPPGFKKSLEERKLRLTEEEQGQLNFAIFLSLFLIYLILGMLYENFFQPLLIMLSIPLALIGVFIAFVVMDYSFDSTAYIGVILLSGIVVNNAILLIDNINRHLSQTKKIVEAIIIGTKERIRPIFMTSATTVLGMLPLIILQGPEKKDIWTSLALCTVGGLTTSALLILLVLPIFYYLFYKLQKLLFPKGQSPQTPEAQAS
jgi:HAE1 family hydrophobic/amphiphilic exporter-1